MSMQANVSDITSNVPTQSALYGAKTTRLLSKCAAAPLKRFLLRPRCVSMQLKVRECGGGGEGNGGDGGGGEGGGDGGGGEGGGDGGGGLGKLRNSVQTYLCSTEHNTDCTCWDVPFTMRQEEGGAAGGDGGGVGGGNGFGQSEQTSL